MTRMERARVWIDLVASISMLAVAAVLIWNAVHSRSTTAVAQVKVPSELQTLTGAHVVGSEEARVGIIEYFDYECPRCADFERLTLPVLQSQYIDRGLLLLARRHLPLTIHPHAEAAAESSECAYRQGRFASYHSALFERGARLDGDGLRSSALAVGIDAKAFETCLGGDVKATVDADRRHAEGLGIRGTPTFYVGGVQSAGLRVTKVVVGAKPTAEFISAIEAVLGARR